MLLFSFILIVLGNNIFSECGKTVMKNSICEIERPPNYKFNFTKLSNEIEDYVVESENVFFHLQLCKQLLKKCNNSTRYAICLYDKEKEIGIGKQPPRIDKRNGEIIFNYIGDHCNNSNTSNFYTTSIKMICDLTMQGATGLRLSSSKYDACNFNMEWRTEAACAPPKKTNCVVDFKSDHYNLTQLRNLSDNYEISVNNTHSIILNVCHSILYRLNACRKYSGACLIDKETNLSTPIGEPSDLTYNTYNNSLSLIYKDSLLCNNNSNTLCTQTTITFICDLDANKSLPQYISGTNSDFEIRWKTIFACNEQNFNIKSIKEKENFLIKAINLTDLINRKFKINVYGSINLNKTIEIPFKSKLNMYSVCGETCNSLSEKLYNQSYIINTNLGYLNINQSSFDKINQTITLMYNNGSVCDKNNPQKRIESKFLLSCLMDDENTGYPILKRIEDDCKYTFEWKTYIICRNIDVPFRKNYFIKLKDFPDLALYFHRNSDFYVRNRQQTNNYSISVCEGLEEVTKINNSNFFRYGKTMNVFYNYTSDSITLRFLNGSKCNNSLATSNFTIVCRDVEYTEPIVIKEEPCYVEFMWYTNKICNSHIKHVIPTTMKIQKIKLSSINYFNEVISTTMKIQEIELSSMNDGVGTGIIISTIIIILILVMMVSYYVKKYKCRDSNARRNYTELKYSPVYFRKMNASQSYLIDKASKSV